MDVGGLITMLLSGLLQILIFIVNFILGMLSVPGAMSFLIALGLFAIAWRMTRNLTGSVIFLAVSFLTIYTMARYLIWPTYIGGSLAGVKSCYASAAGNPAAEVPCKIQEAGLAGLPFQIPGISNSLKEQTSLVSPKQGEQIYVGEPEQEPEPVKYKRKWLKDGLSRLSSTWSLKPGGWPSKSGGLIGPSNVPLGVRVYLSCISCGPAKGEEIWKLKLVDEQNGMTTVELEVNGYFAREGEGFNAIPAGVVVAGRGSWDDLCPSCFIDEVVATPVQPTQPPPLATPSPPAPSGNWWERPGIVFPFEFSAYGVTPAGAPKKFDACGWASAYSLIVCDQRDRPSDERFGVNPADPALAGLPHP